MGRVTNWLEKNAPWISVTASGIGIGMAIRDSIQYFKDKRLERKMDEMRHKMVEFHSDREISESMIVAQLEDLQEQNNRLMEEAIRRTEGD